MDPAIAYGIVFSNFMKKGIYTFKDGTDSLIKKMVTSCAKTGGTRRQSMVESLITMKRTGSIMIRRHGEWQNPMQSSAFQRQLEKHH